MRGEERQKQVLLSPIKVFITFYVTHLLAYTKAHSLCLMNLQSDEETDTTLNHPVSCESCVRCMRNNEHSKSTKKLCL